MFNSGNANSGTGAPKPAFNFGAAAGSGSSNATGSTSGGLFGNTSTANTGFGTSTTNSASGASAPAGGFKFGETSTGKTPGNPGPFGSAASGSLFNKSDSNTASGNAGNIGGVSDKPSNSLSTQGGSLFGNKAQQNTGLTFGAPNSAAGGAFGSALASKDTTSGAAAGTGSSLFGSNAGSNSNANSGTLFGSSSSTLGGPKASSESDNKATSGGLFGAPSGTKGPGLFGSGSSANQSENKTGLSGTATNSTSLFGSSSKPAETGSNDNSAEKKEEKPAASGGLFGKPSSGGLFGGGVSAASATTSTPSKDGFGAPTTGGFTFGQSKKTDDKAVGTGLFGAASAEKKSEPAASGFSFGSSAAKGTNDAKPALFGAQGATAAEKKPEATEKKEAAAGPSFSFGGHKEASEKTDGPSTTTFGATATQKQEEKPASTFGSASSASTEKKGENSSSKDSNATSVPINQGEYLKNKSFEDIIAKWMSALTKSVDRFKEQSAETAKWDQILVENGSKIAGIYEEVMAVEVAQTRIDDVLSYVGRQQDDMDSMLTQLERQTSASSSSGALFDNLQPVDKERHDAYSLAEQLNEKLDGLEGNLTSVIEEINQLTRDEHNVKDTDPIAQIVKILNAHLASLQFIDDGASKLQKKLANARTDSWRLRL